MHQVQSIRVGQIISEITRRGGQTITAILLPPGPHYSRNRWVRWVRNIQFTELSQQQVADTIAMNRVQYTRIETGKADITITTLQKIANVLDVPVVDFFKEDGAEVNSYVKNILEKVKLIEQLDDTQKKSLFTFIDTAIANKRLKDTLNSALSVAS